MKLEVKDASIGYKKQVLSSNINMASEPGMVTAILGQNGCGKTTFVKSLMKLTPKQATLIIDGTYTMVRRRRIFRWC